MDTSNISMHVLMESLEYKPESKSILALVKNISLTESENFAIVRTDKGNNVVSVKNGKRYIDSLNRKLTID